MTFCYSIYCIFGERKHWLSCGKAEIDIIEDIFNTRLHLGRRSWGSSVTPLNLGKKGLISDILNGSMVDLLLFQATQVQ